MGVLLFDTVCHGINVIKFMEAIANAILDKCPCFRATENTVFAKEPQMEGGRIGDALAAGEIEMEDATFTTTAFLANDFG